MINSSSTKGTIGILRELDLGPKSLNELEISLNAPKSFLINVILLYFDLGFIIKPNSKYQLTKFGSEYLDRLPKESTILDWGEQKPDSVKTCNKCGQEKPLSEFHKSHHRKGGYQPRCKTCQTTERAKLKTCSVCKVDKPLHLFKKNSNVSGGITSTCLACHSLRQKFYRERKKAIPKESLTRVCFRCKASKPLTEFYKNRNSLDGRGSWCKACKDTYDASYRAIKRRKGVQSGVTEEKPSVKIIPINKVIAMPEHDLKISCLTERTSKPDISVEFISRVVTVLEQGLELNQKQYELFLEFLELSKKTGNKPQEVTEES